MLFGLMLQQALAQQKAISLEEIWNGSFDTETLYALRSMSDGKEYTVLHADPASHSSSIAAYSYKTLDKTETLVASGGPGNIPYFTSYKFSRDESLILLATGEESIYRRSTQAVYYVYDRGKKELTQISENKIREPAFSPDGHYVAYVYQNNLYLYDLPAKTTRQITSDGKENHVINGLSDWVYEEEFSLVKAYEWNPEGNRIAFLRFDESSVPWFTMELYGDWLYPYPYQFKYPKAGEDNSFVSLHLYDLESGETQRVSLLQDYYIPRIKWMHKPGQLSVMTLNRHQDRLQLYKVDAPTAKASLLLEERDDAYVDITDNHFLDFLPDDRFLWTSERDGYNHLYLFGPDGKLLRQLTKGPWEVTDCYGFDPQTEQVYYQSNETGSTRRGLYAIGIRGDGKKQLSSRPGTHEADFSSDYSYYIDTYSNSNTPPEYTLHLARNGKAVRLIKDNSALLEKLRQYQWSPREYSTLTLNGSDLNMWMVKPPDFDPSKKYPLLLYQYSGPGSQVVADSWMGSNDYWHQVLAASGIVVACVDGRGTGFKGRDFEKQTYLELGKYEVADQIAAAQKLSELPYIDPARTGIWGWSYGGFMASNCILKGHDTFEVAIAVAPVTNWRFYDTIYTERYMRTPEENPSGYDENSPLNFASMLQGDYLLVHGSADDNVHVQNSMRMIDALVQADKTFQWAIYPDRDHGIDGGNYRLHLFRMMTGFLERHLLQTDKNQSHDPIH